MSYTAAQVAMIRAKAVEIASRGVTYVQVGDRTYRFTELTKLEEFARAMESQILDDEHGGFMDIKMARDS